MRRDDQVLSLKSRGFPSALAIKDSLIGLWTPCRCYQLARRRGKKEERRKSRETSSSLKAFFFSFLEKVLINVGTQHRHAEERRSAKDD